MPRPDLRRAAAAAALLATALSATGLLTGCSLVTITDPLAGAKIDANEVLITGAEVGGLGGEGLGGAEALEATEPFAETVDDYLASRAVGIPAVEPERCGDAVVDLVLLDRDAGAAGTVYTPPRIVFPDGTEVVQTAREFPTDDAADAFFTAYRGALEDCTSFTVETADGDVAVEQSVSDAWADIDGFVVRLAITEPGGVESHNEQWILRDGPFAVLVSAAGAGPASDDPADRRVLEGVVSAVRDRLIAAVDRLDGS